MQLTCIHVSLPQCAECSAQVVSSPTSGTRGNVGSGESRSAGCEIPRFAPFVAEVFLEVSEHLVKAFLVHRATDDFIWKSDPQRFGDHCSADLSADVPKPRVRTNQQPSNARLRSRKARPARGWPGLCLQLEATLKTQGDLAAAPCMLSNCHRCDVIRQLLDFSKNFLTCSVVLNRNARLRAH